MSVGTDLTSQGIHSHVPMPSASPWLTQAQQVTVDSLAVCPSTQPGLTPLSPALEQTGP